MNIPSSMSTTSDMYPGVHFMDGTGSQGSYAVIARRGSVFLGIRLLGLMDGIKLGVPGKTYLHARVRSARSHGLAQQLDLEAGVENVVSLSQHQLTPDAAWPNLIFEKNDEERASLVLGVFIDGSLSEETDLVVGRLEKADLFRKFVDYLINRTGHEYRVAPARVAAAWLFAQAEPILDGLKKAAGHHKNVLATQKEFEGLIEGQLGVVGPHLQQLKAIYNKHQKGQETPEAG